MNILEVKNLVRNYKTDISVLKGISFTVEEGEFVGIMGKSGCGKTTLLKVLGMIDKQTSGEVMFMEKPTTDFSNDTLAQIRRTEIGFIFQDFYLMDSLSVEENIMMPMILNKEKFEKMELTVKNYTNYFQIAHLLKKNPYELSGGEKQLAAICRALVNDPSLILADEPTGNLDSASGKIVVDALKWINETNNKTIVMVTHDPQMASYCNRIILLKDGQILNTLVRESTPEEFYLKIIQEMANL